MMLDTVCHDVLEKQYNEYNLRSYMRALHLSLCHLNLVTYIRRRPGSLHDLFVHFLFRTPLPSRIDPVTKR